MCVIIQDKRLTMINHKKLKSILLALSVSIACVCCTRGAGDTPSIDNQGEIAVALSTDSTFYSFEITTKSAELTPEDFNIHLENTKAEVLASWETYSQAPNPLKALFGSYKLVARHGDLNALPAFEAGVFGAESKFSISQDAPTTTAMLDCKPLATKVMVDFAPDFGYTYSSWEIAVKTTGDSLHHKAADFSREGFYNPGRLRFMLSLWDKQATPQKHIFYYDTKITTQAAEAYMVTFNAVNNSGEAAISITTDTGTTDMSITTELPSFWMPRAAPKVVSHTFGESNIVETPRARKANSDVILTTYAGVSSLKVETTSQELLELGFPATGVELVGTALDHQNIVLMKNLGISWSEDLSDPLRAKQIMSNRPILLSFTDLSMNLDQHGEHHFTITMSDYLNESMQQSLAEPFTMAIKINPMVVDLEPMTLGNVWAKWAVATTSCVVDREGMSVKLQASSDGGTTWSDLTNEIIESNESATQIKILGLTPDTDYIFRAYVDADGVSSPSGVMRTESEAQIPNGDMEDWGMDLSDGKQFFGSSYKVARYYPWTSGGTQYWDTSNDRTTWYYALVASSRNQYTWASSTVYTNTSRSGRAAELRNISAQIALTPVNSSGANESKNCVAGHLFLGDYSSNDGGDVKFDFNRTFGSRPATLKFWYQYLPLNNDEALAYIQVWNINGDTRTELGYGEVKITGTQNTYKQMSVDVAYTVTNMRATHYTVLFKSSTASTPPTSTNVSIDYPGSPNSSLKGHIGSKLRIDDITLEY